MHDHVSEDSLTLSFSVYSAAANVNLSESGETEPLAEAQSGGSPTAEGTLI